MDTLARTLAIIVEVFILAVIAFAVLNGVRLTVFDLGINSKYGKALTMFLVVVGIIFIFFFVAHLTSFYPTIG
jgi:succinate dehydrogenase/fumarate reductase cytochrome b subunit